MLFVEPWISETTHVVTALGSDAQSEPMRGQLEFVWERFGFFKITGGNRGRLHKDMAHKNKNDTQTSPSQKTCATIKLKTHRYCAPVMKPFVSIVWCREQLKSGSVGWKKSAPNISVWAMFFPESVFCVTCTTPLAHVPNSFRTQPQWRRHLSVVLID